MSNRSKTTRVAALWLACFQLITLAPGCRVLQARQTKDLPQARKYSLLGADALQQRKYDDAESLFVEALRHSPNDERAQWGYAEVLWQRGQSEVATRHMSQAVELSGANPDLQVRLGQMYLEQRDFKRAMEMAESALRTHRNDPAAWALKADVLRCSSKMEEAIACYHRALLYRPDWPEVQVTVAELYRLTSKPQRALATLDRMNDQHSEPQIPPRAYLLRAQALADLDEPQAALMCLRSAAPKLSAEQSELLVEFAQLQSQLGDVVEARLCLNRALQHNPTNSAALRLQASLDQQSQNPSGTKTPVMWVGHPKPSGQ